MSPIFLPVNCKHACGAISGQPARTISVIPSRAARGLAAFTSLMDLPGRAAMLLVPAFFAGMVQAGGLEEEAVAPDPCPALVRDGSMTDEMMRGFLAIRRMSCPDLVPVVIDRATGKPLTDAEKLRRVFNGSRVPTVVARGPEVVPLPGAGWMLLAGLGWLALLRARG